MKPTASEADVSARARRNAAFVNYLNVGYTKASANPFNIATSPAGVINLGTAENKLMNDWLLDRV
jgi:hypothetical protein